MCVNNLNNGIHAWTIKFVQCRGTSVISNRGCPTTHAERRWRPAGGHWQHATAADVVTWLKATQADERTNEPTCLISVNGCKFPAEQNGAGATDWYIWLVSMHTQTRTHPGDLWRIVVLGILSLSLSLGPCRQTGLARLQLVLHVSIISEID